MTRIVRLANRIARPRHGCSSSVTAASPRKTATTFALPTPASATSHDNQMTFARRRRSGPNTITRWIPPALPNVFVLRFFPTHFLHFAIAVLAWSAAVQLFTRPGEPQRNADVLTTTDQVVQPQPLAASTYDEPLYEGGVNASRTIQHITRSFGRVNVQRFNTSTYISRKVPTQVGPYEGEVSYESQTALPSQDGTQRSPPMSER